MAWKNTADFCLGIREDSGDLKNQGEDPYKIFLGRIVDISESG